MTIIANTAFYAMTTDLAINSPKKLNKQDKEDYCEHSTLGTIKVYWDWQTALIITDNTDVTLALAVNAISGVAAEVDENDDLVVAYISNRVGYVRFGASPSTVNLGEANQVFLIKEPTSGIQRLYYVVGQSIYLRTSDTSFATGTLQTSLVLRAGEKIKCVGINTATGYLTLITRNNIHKVGQDAEPADGPLMYNDLNILKCGDFTLAESEAI